MKTNDLHEMQREIIGIANAMQIALMHKPMPRNALQKLNTSHAHLLRAAELVESARILMGEAVDEVAEERYAT